MVGGNDGIGAPVDDQRWFAAQRAGGADLVDADADPPVKQPFFIGQLLPCSRISAGNESMQVKGTGKILIRA